MAGGYKEQWSISNSTVERKNTKQERSKHGPLIKFKVGSGAIGVEHPLICFN